MYRGVSPWSRLYLPSKWPVLASKWPLLCLYLASKSAVQWLHAPKCCLQCL